MAKAAMQQNHGRAGPVGRIPDSSTVVVQVVLFAWNRQGQSAMRFEILQVVVIGCHRISVQCSSFRRDDVQGASVGTTTSKSWRKTGGSSVREGADEENPEKPNSLPIRSVCHPEMTIIGSITTVLFTYTATAESSIGEFIMNEFWFTDPIAICFAAAGLGLLALVVWFIKMDLRHRPKRAKKLP